MYSCHASKMVDFLNNCPLCILLSIFLCSHLVYSLLIMFRPASGSRCWRKISVSPKSLFLLTVPKWFLCCSCALLVVGYCNCAVVPCDLFVPGLYFLYCLGKSVLRDSDRPCFPD